MIVDREKDEHEQQHVEVHGYGETVIGEEAPFQREEAVFPIINDSFSEKEGFVCQINFKTLIKIKLVRIVPAMGG